VAVRLVTDLSPTSTIVGRAPESTCENEVMLKHPTKSCHVFCILSPVERFRGGSR
jgi:hypothetical protein